MSLIGIKLDGIDEYLQTRDDTVIELTLENPILGDDNVLSPGSGSMPFNLPGGEGSPENAALLKNPDVIENSEAYQIKSASLSFDGVPLKKGTLKAYSAPANTISTYFKFGLNSISEELKTKKLRDLVNELVVIDATPIEKKIFVKKNSGGASLSISVNGKQYDAPHLTGLYTLINADADAALDTGKAMPYAEIVFAGDSPNGITPEYLMIRLSYFQTVFGFPTRSYSTDPLAELYISVDPAVAGDYLIDCMDMDDYYDGFETFLEGYITGDYPTESLRFPVMFNPGLYGDKNLKEGELINGVNSSGIIRNSPTTTRKNFNSIQPFIRLKWLIETIAEYFGLPGVEGDFYEDPEVAGKLIDNSQTLDVPLFFIGDKEFVFWRRSFNMNELVPDVKVLDFLKGIASRYNLGVDVNEQNNKLRVIYREPIAKSNEHNDITALCSPIDTPEDARITGFTLSCGKEESDAFSVDESVTVGTSEETYEMSCGRLHQINITTQDVGVVLGPRTSRKNGDRFGLRVFHYLGMVDNGVFSYPAADISPPGFAEGINDFIVLQGVYNRYWKYWLYFKSRRQLVKIKIDFPLRMIINFDWQIKRRFDRSNFIVKSMKVRMTNQRLDVTEVQLYTMN